jgi:CMP-N-acetylneuraminic acid synthetase
MSLNVFLPCRKGSERVPKKNIKPFGDFENGLIEIKLKQLINTRQVSKIYLSTNDDEILEFAKKLDNEKIVIHKRCEELSSSETSTDDLIAHALELIQEGDILWTHVTSPFLNSSDYDDIITKYYDMLNNGVDSLMTTSLIHGFLWNEKGPINYDRNKEKWPRTQTIEPIHEINSAVFIANAEIYKKQNDRIGVNPYLYSLDKIKGFDIDWEEDFKIAEIILKSNITII